MNLDEDTVRAALARLEELRLARPAGGTDSRVTKYEHRVYDLFKFTRPEVAILCVLLLRGSQTPGELRGRTERLHGFEELEDVIGVLQRLMRREPPLVRVLPRQPGTKEARYAHTLAGDAPEPEQQETSRSAPPKEGTSRIEEEIAALRNDVEALKQAFA